jgi:hypothetical protein
MEQPAGVTCGFETAIDDFRFVPSVHSEYVLSMIPVSKNYFLKSFLLLSQGYN